MKKTKNDLLIGEEDYSILKKYGIECNLYNSYTAILYEINSILNDEELSDAEYEELDLIANTLQERNYYQNTKK